MYVKCAYNIIRKMHINSQPKTPKKLNEDKIQSYYNIYKMRVQNYHLLPIFSLRYYLFNLKQANHGYLWII